METILLFDNAVLTWIQQHMTSPAGDFFMPAVTALGEFGLIWLAAAAVLLCRKGTRRTAVEMLAALLIVLVVCNLTLKPLVDRTRPFAANGFEGLLIAAPTDPSFPSGHTASSFAAAAAWFRRDKRWGSAALVLAALIAFSRLYLYVHYPSDVLAGATLGVAAAFLAGWIVKKAEALRKAG